MPSVRFPFALALGIAIAAGGVGCFLSDDGTSASSADVESSEKGAAEALTSIVLLQEKTSDGTYRTRCTAAVVGPQALLLTARCVRAGSKLDGKELKLVVLGDGSEKTVKVAEVKVHPSYDANHCEEGACALGKAAGGSNASDIALVVTEKKIDVLTYLTVNLDRVEEGKSLLALSSGCAKITAAAGERTFHAVKAVPASAADHEGSPYRAHADLVERLDRSYVVTSEAPSELCKADLGAPLVSITVGSVGDQTFVLPSLAGVAANYTLEANVPTTVHYTRIDSVASWVESVGDATKGIHATTRTISKADAGDAGIVVRDAAAGDAEAGVAPSTPPPCPDPNNPACNQGGREPDPEEAPSSANPGDDGRENADEDDVYAPDEFSGSAGSTTVKRDGGAVAVRKASKSQASCASSPGRGGSGCGALVGFGLAVAGFRRRRRPTG